MSGYQIAKETIDGLEILTVTMPGAARFETIMALLRELDGLRPTRVLIDQSGLRPGLVGPGQIQEIAHQWRTATALGTARIAVYASNLVVFALNRMFQGFAASEGRVAVFHDREAATAWLLGSGTDE
jgi:hypothetical protein